MRRARLPDRRPWRSTSRRTASRSSRSTSRWPATCASRRRHQDQHRRSSASATWPSTSPSAPSRWRHGAPGAGACDFAVMAEPRRSACREGARRAGARSDADVARARAAAPTTRSTTSTASSSRSSRTAIRERPRAPRRDRAPVPASRVTSSALADHATNIAEDVIYMVEGEIHRHQCRTRRPSCCAGTIAGCERRRRLRPSFPAARSSCLARATGKARAATRAHPYRARVARAYALGCASAGVARRAADDAALGRGALLDGDGDRGRVSLARGRSSTWWSAPGSRRRCTSEYVAL